MRSVKLTYTVENSTLVQSEREAEVDGETVTVRSSRLSVEAIPQDTRNGTLTLSLSADLADAFPEGSEITVTIAVPKE